MSKWKIVKLNELAVRMHQGINTVTENVQYQTCGIPIIQSKNITQGYLDLNDVRYLSYDDYEKYYEKYNPCMGDVLVANIGTIGKSLVLRETEKFLIAWNLFLIALDKNMTFPMYFKHFMEYLSITHYYDGLLSGGTVKFINKKKMGDIPIPLPPLEEQKRIADILDKASNLIELRKQQLEKMDLLIKSKFIDMFGDPVTNPKGWDMKKISDVCIINPRKTELGSIPDDLEVSFIPMASVSEKGDIRTNEIKKYSEVKTGFTYFHEGDVLFAKITPCMENGKGAIAINLKNLIGFGSTEFHVIRPIENITNSEWIFNLLVFKWLREDAEKNMTGSAGQRRVPASYFEKCKVSVPPIELQNQFAEFVEQAEKQKTVMQQSLEKMEMNYKALMQEYFG